MKEYMFLIRNFGDAKAPLSPDQHLAFVKKCEVYIGELKKDNKLIAAQPLVREGALVTKLDKDWKVEMLDAAKQVQVGYYHILAKDLDEAIAIAKENPEFEFIPSATIEVRPIKTKEKETNFVYPK
jgi:hypothetical protein